jgi:hypothetical protein
MTTGNISTGDFSYINPNFANKKVWSGGDGKYEVVGGHKRTKWNSFTTERAQKSDFIGYSVVFGTAGAIVNSKGTINNLIPFNNAESNALSKLVEEIKGHSFNLAVDASQGKQTVNLISSNLSHVGNALVNLKRGNFAGAARELGIRARPSRLKTTDVSGRWLEMQYGWLPFLSSSFESMKAFHRISKGPRSTTYRVRVKKEGDGDNSQSDVNYTYPYHAKRMCIIQAELYEELSANRSLGLMDPLSVLWENVPYSFVLDWFLPVGNYLDQLAILPFLKGRFLTTNVWKAESKFGKDKIRPPTVSNRYRGRQVGHYTRVERTVSTNLFPPRPRFNSFPAAMSGKRILNAVSLFHQALSR